jgi:hypothetical protein
MTLSIHQTEVVRGRGAFYPHVPYARIVEPGHDGEQPYCADCQKPLRPVSDLVWACSNSEYHGTVPALWVSNRLANVWNGDGLLHRRFSNPVAEHLAAVALESDDDEADTVWATVYFYGRPVNVKVLLSEVETAYAALPPTWEL